MTTTQRVAPRLHLRLADETQYWIERLDQKSRAGVRICLTDPAGHIAAPWRDAFRPTGSTIWSKCAANVFIEQGYRRTQMADVADALGVAKGTLYLYVESKEALFDLVVPPCRRRRRPTVRGALPLPCGRRRPARRSATCGEELERQSVPDPRRRARTQRVTDAPASSNTSSASSTTLARNRRGIKLLDRSAPRLPELAALWFEGARGGLLALLEQYLESTDRRGPSAPVPDVRPRRASSSRRSSSGPSTATGTPHPQSVSDEVAQATGRSLRRRALTKE